MTFGTPVASPAADPIPYGIDRVKLAPDLGPAGLANLFYTLPDEVAGLALSDVTTATDSATVVYIDDETAAQPKFGLLVGLIVEPNPDAEAQVEAIERTRWGPLDQHTITTANPGFGDSPAFREFWRQFPPGLFALPNQPIYFLIWYRANDGYAFMLITANPALRKALAEAITPVLAG